MQKQKCVLKCIKCGRTEKSFKLYCSDCKKDSLLKSFYNPHKTNIKKDRSLFSSYLDLLPASSIRDIEHQPSIGLFKSNLLAEALKLENLYILFTGHWPEKDTYNIAGSFKLFEAISVIEKTVEENKILIISSSGNTAKAVVQYSILSGHRSVVVIPESAEPLIQVSNPHHRRNTFLITVRDGFYSEAIKVVDKIVSNVDGLSREGGVYNVARRDALGVPFFAACYGMGFIPDHYFQAIGSGTGAIAALEAIDKVVVIAPPLLPGDIKSKKIKMRLRLSQNEPFCPVARAWDKRKRDYIKYSPAQYRERIESIIAKVLSNNSPPYSVTGGLFDALRRTEGSVDCISNEEVNEAMRFFYKLKKQDLDPAAAVALASLKKAVSRKTIRASDTILLHLTGGGYSTLEKSYNLSFYKPDISVDCWGDMAPIYSAVERFVGIAE